MELGRLLLDCTEWFSVRYPHGLSVQEGESVLDALVVEGHWLQSDLLTRLT